MFQRPSALQVPKPQSPASVVGAPTFPVGLDVLALLVVDTSLSPESGLIVGWGVSPVLPDVVCPLPVVSLGSPRAKRPAVA